MKKTKVKKGGARNDAPIYAVLGGYGEMGSIIVRDLVESAKNAEIWIVGHNGAKAKAFAASFRNPRVKWKSLDISNAAQLAKFLYQKNKTKKSVCINAAQYYSNLRVMHACLKAKTHYVDLGGLFHMTKKQLRLNKIFKKSGLTAALGCGATPGITNVMAAYGAQFFDKIHEVHIRFGGKDYTNYRQPFTLPYSAQTILDEFSIKAAIFRKKIKMIKPFSDQEFENFPSPVGKAQCGSVLHSELATLPRFLRNKKIRICTFKAGFDENFSQFFLLLARLGFHKAAARRLTVEFLNKFMPDPRTRVNDMEILRVRINGKAKNLKRALIMDCMARSSKKWNASAGTVDTAIPCSIIAQMIANGRIAGRGVLPPENCVPPELFFKELSKRDIKIKIYDRN